MNEQPTEIPIEVVLSNYEKELAGLLRRALLAESENLILKQQLDALTLSEGQ